MERENKLFSSERLKSRKKIHEALICVKVKTRIITFVMGVRESHWRVKKNVIACWNSTGNILVLFFVKLPRWLDWYSSTCILLLALPMKIIKYFIVCGFMLCRKKSKGWCNLQTELSAHWLENLLCNSAWKVSNRFALKVIKNENEKVVP